VDRPVSFKSLRKILRAYGVFENPSKGKGSHTYFEKAIGNGIVGLPVPTDKDPPLICYVKQLRRKFKLTSNDGVTDDEFYSHA
jgi:hypothetical protein